MITNCEHCSAEVEDDAIGHCDVCDHDGLCPDCLHHDFHTTPTQRTREGQQPTTEPGRHADQDGDQRED